VGTAKDSKHREVLGRILLGLEERNVHRLVYLA
jgi:hypothetical protein